MNAVPAPPRDAARCAAGERFFTRRPTRREFAFLAARGELAVAVQVRRLADSVRIRSFVTSQEGRN